MCMSALQFSLFDVDMRIMIDKTLTHSYNYIIGKSKIILTSTYIIVLDIYGKHDLKHFTI